MAIKPNQCAYKVLVKLNEQFQEKCIGDKYLKEEEVLYLREGTVCNDTKGQYVYLSGASGLTSGYAYLNELDLLFNFDAILKINAITLLNYSGSKKLIFVENFEDENIRKSISKSLNIDVENLELVKNREDDYLIYGIKEIVPSLVGKLESINLFYAENPPRHYYYIHILKTSL